MYIHTYKYTYLRVQNSLAHTSLGLYSQATAVTHHPQAQTLMNMHAYDTHAHTHIDACACTHVHTNTCARSLITNTCARITPVYTTHRHANERCHTHAVTFSTYGYVLV